MDRSSPAEDESIKHLLCDPVLYTTFDLLSSESLNLYFPGEEIEV